MTRRPDNGSEHWCERGIRSGKKLSGMIGATIAVMIVGATPLMRRIIVAVVLIAFLDCNASGSREAPAEQAAQLPPMALDGVPAPVRADIEQAYQAAQSDAGNAETTGHLAMLFHAYGQYRLAASCYGTARQLDQKSFSWTYLSGVVQSELGDFSSAAKFFADALRLDASYLPARLRLAEALMKSGELQPSRGAYEAVVREFPDLALAHYGLGYLLSTLGDRTKAANHYQRAVELVPQFGGAHYALALLYRSRGEPDRAQPHFAAYQKFGNRRAGLSDPLLERVASLKNAARDLIAEAARLGEAGKLDESIALHVKALERDPLAAQAHVNLISLYGRSDRPKEAEAHYRAALALGANLAEAHYNYGVLLVTAGRHAEAAGAFRQAIEVNPFHAQAHNNLGGLLAREGKLEDAIGEYHQAIASDPQHRPSRFNLARALVAVGRSAEAIEQFQRILTPEDSDTPRYTFALASAHFKAGNIAQAREYAERALRGARRLDQNELAAMIERALGQMPQSAPK
jgi:tetratricopeptide (TPR) repeat protein